MILETVANNIVLEKNGIYYSKNDTSISYPEEGNANCMQYEDDSFWFKHRNNIISNSIKKVCPNETFFDIGGGNGFVSKGLQNLNIKTVLVEPGKLGAVNAKNRGVENVLCSTLKDAGFKKESISSVGFFDVLEHIEDDSNFIEDISSYLKKDGHLFMTVPAKQFLWSEDDEYAGHYRRYDLKSIKKLFESKGFKIKYSTYFFSILIFPVFIFRRIPYLLKIGVNPENIEKQKKDHLPKENFLSKALNKIWRWEEKNILNNKSLAIGSSCFIIAKKIR